MTGRRAIPWILLGAIGWGYVLVLGASMSSTEPPTAGFDLNLLLDAGRRVAAGTSPYADALVEGGRTTATNLFYSYPPPVAQAMALVSGVPDRLALLLWGVLATVAAIVVGVTVARRSGSPRTRPELALMVGGGLPLVLPFSIAVLFGNVNAWFPALYGAMVLALVPIARRDGVIGGVALAAVAAAKLHPGSLLAWFAVRGWRPGAAARPEGRAARTVLVAAVATGLGILLVSLAIGGTRPWADYVAVVRAGTDFDVADPRNAGPAAIIGLLLRLDGGDIRVVQVGVTLAAVATTIITAWRVRDPLTGFAIAVVASLVTLPVTWYHYPVALIPIAIAALARVDAVEGATRRRTALLVLAAVVAVDIAIAVVPLIWIGIGLLVAAVVASRPGYIDGRVPVTAGPSGDGAAVRTDDT